MASARVPLPMRPMLRKWPAGGPPRPACVFAKEQHWFICFPGFKREQLPLLIWRSNIPLQFTVDTTSRMHHNYTPATQYVLSCPSYAAQARPHTCRSSQTCNHTCCSPTASLRRSCARPQRITQRGLPQTPNQLSLVQTQTAPQSSQITMRMVVLAACGDMHQAASLRQNRLQPRAPNSSQPDLGTVVALRANALAAHRDGRAGPLRARGLEGCRVPPRLARGWALRPIPRGKVRPGGPTSSPRPGTAHAGMLGAGLSRRASRAVGPCAAAARTSQNGVGLGVDRFVLKGSACKDTQRPGATCVKTQ